MSATLELDTAHTYDEAFSHEVAEPAAYLERKRRAVQVLGILLGVFLTPIIFLLMAAVRLTSSGPGLYRQRRVGLHGRVFTIYKLRSMRADAEVKSGPTWATTNDPRVTPLGRFLRWTHLDELPQIFNVMRGEMDFVGPRPERPEIIEKIVERVPEYLARHDAKPGITGLAQVNLWPDENIESVCNKVGADLHYIRTANPWLDIRLVLATVLRIVGIRYEVGARLLRVELPQEAIEASQRLLRHAAESHATTTPLTPACDETATFVALSDTIVSENRVRPPLAEIARDIRRAPR